MIQKTSVIRDWFEILIYFILLSYVQLAFYIQHNEANRVEHIATQTFS